MAMENRTGLLGVRLKDKVETHRKALCMAAVSLTGYILACSRVFDGAAPFGIAFCAILRAPYSIFGALGTLLGYAFGGMLDNMKYIAAILLVITLQWLFAGRFGERFATAESAGIALFSLGTAGVAAAVLSDATLYEVMLLFAEVFLCAGATYFFARAMYAVQAGWTGVTRSDVSCIIVSFAVVVMGLSSITPGGISVGRIVSALVVLLCARMGSEAGGAVAGVTAGIAMGLSGGDYAYAISAYGFGGLMAGVFAGLGRIATAGAFIMVNTIAGLFTKPAGEVYLALAEIFLASVAFSAIPQSVFSRFRMARLGRTLQAEASAQGALRGRLAEIAEALQEIGQTTREVSQRLSRLEQNGTTDVTARVAEHVCMRCGSKSSCWQLYYTDTMNVINDAMRVLRREGSLHTQDLAEHFVARCHRAEAFALELNHQFSGQLAREQVQRKVGQVREVITDQFTGIAQMLEELSGELCDVNLFDAQKLRRVREYFEQAGLAIQQVRGYTDGNDRATIEIVIPSYETPRLDGVQSAIALSGLLETEFDLPYIANQKKMATVVFLEKAAYCVEVGAYQISPEGNRLCGDAYAQMPNHRGWAHMILSDGMGCGGGAAVDAHMATGLLNRLLEVGFSHDAALNMVNAALLVKSGEESLATVDICSIDLYTGRAELYKAGAAPTFLIRGGKAGVLESTSLPAGILHGVAFDHSSCALQEGDIIVMVSDGVIATGVNWVRTELPALACSDMQRLAEKLAMTAKIRRTDGREDDITVLAIALHHGG